MLELDDPLWKKLDDGGGALDVARTLGELGTAWNPETSERLMWTHLCHSDTCYGSTFAAVPHLLQIAEPEQNKDQRLEIALFLGHVVFVGFLDNPFAGQVSQPGSADVLQGLPRSQKAWDEKLAHCRDAVRHSETADRPVDEWWRQWLDRARERLALGSMTEVEMGKIRQIEEEFVAARAKIRDLCETAFLENLAHEHAPLRLLAGIAACQGMYGLADLCESGRQGQFHCPACGWRFEYIQFGEKLAFCADDHPPEPSDRNDPGHLKQPWERPKHQDFLAGQPNHADGFMDPVADPANSADAREAHILDLARRAADDNVELLVRHFLGGFNCPRCAGPVALPR